MRVERIKDTRRDFQRFFGVALTVLAARGVYADMRLEDAALLVGHSISHRQILVGYDRYGAPVGFLAYAFFSSDTERSWRSSSGHSLDPTEFDEGGELWVTVFACRDGLTREFIRSAKAFIPSGHDQARSIRRRHGRPSGPVRTWRRQALQIT